MLTGVFCARPNTWHRFEILRGYLSSCVENAYTGTNRMVSVIQIRCDDGLTHVEAVEVDRLAVHFGRRMLMDRIWMQIEISQKDCQCI